MKVIDLENHFSTPLNKQALRQSTGYPRSEEGRGIGFFEDTWIPEPPGEPDRKLADLGEGRIRAMDEAGIDIAVLSLLASGVEPLDPAVGVEVARDANDRLAAAVSAYPDRLIGTATVAVKATEEALRELERCVKELGFKIWFAHSNFGDSYLDEPRYWPLLAKAEELGVPIYLHPTAPMIPELPPSAIVSRDPPSGSASRWPTSF
jgi:predicted TIM-barrel fold metal-dependent hydrolase